MIWDANKMTLNMLKWICTKCKVYDKTTSEHATHATVRMLLFYFVSISCVSSWVVSGYVCVLCVLCGFAILKVASSSCETVHAAPNAGTSIIIFGWWRSCCLAMLWLVVRTFDVMTLWTSISWCCPSFHLTSERKNKWKSRTICECGWNER